MIRKDSLTQLLLTSAFFSIVLHYVLDLHEPWYQAAVNLTILSFLVHFMPDER